MKAKRVRLFIKPNCGWCDEAMAWLDERGIAYEVLDVIADVAAGKEMFALSGQTLAPVLDVDGEVLADFGAEELAEWWNQQGFEPV
jgi:arsenate reductase-like glutaredoxin family protein